jgi:biotin synthase
MNKGISRAEALELMACQGPELFELLQRAGALRLQRRGRVVDPCAIINAKSGHCDQDCAFCSQSSRSRAPIETYPLRSAAELWADVQQAAATGARRVSLVTAGRAVVAPEQLGRLAEVYSTMAVQLPVGRCASLGLMSLDGLRLLKEAELQRYHHNLESAESFFPRICSTRRWSDSLRTLEAARGLGMELCCGGIFGLGESLEQRVELLEQIRALDVTSVPLNFLHAIEGTPLEGHQDLSPLTCLKIVAVARLMFPLQEVRVCGGREHNLRDLQSWILLAGADGLMVGGYLTTGGRTVADDLQMVGDAGLELSSYPSSL